MTCKLPYKYQIIKSYKNSHFYLYIFEKHKLSHSQLTKHILAKESCLIVEQVCLLMKYILGMF